MRAPDYKWGDQISFSEVRAGDIINFNKSKVTYELVNSETLQTQKTPSVNSPKLISTVIKQPNLTGIVFYHNLAKKSLNIMHRKQFHQNRYILIIEKYYYDGQSSDNLFDKAKFYRANRLDSFDRSTQVEVKNLLKLRPLVVTEKDETVYSRRKADTPDIPKRSILTQSTLSKKEKLMSNNKKNRAQKINKRLSTTSIVKPPSLSHLPVKHEYLKLKKAVSLKEIGARSLQEKLESYSLKNFNVEDIEPQVFVKPPESTALTLRLTKIAPQIQNSWHPTTEKRYCDFKVYSCDPVNGKPEKSEFLQVRGKLVTKVSDDILLKNLEDLEKAWNNQAYEYLPHFAPPIEKLPTDYYYNMQIDRLEKSTDYVKLIQTSVLKYTIKPENVTGLSEYSFKVTHIQPFEVEDIYPKPTDFEVEKALQQAQQAGPLNYQIIQQALQDFRLMSRYSQRVFKKV